MKLHSRETLYRARSTFQGVDSHAQIPSFGFGKADTVDGFVSKDGQHLYFGCLAGVYAENPTKTPFKHSMSWDSSTRVLSAYFAMEDGEVSGLHLGGTAQEPVSMTFESPERFNGIVVESFENRTVIHPSRLQFLGSHVEVHPISGGEETNGYAVDRLVNQHIDIILDKILKKA